MKKPPTDVGASVRARLLRLAREQGEDLQLLLTRYATDDSFNNPGKIGLWTKADSVIQFDDLTVIPK